MGDLFENILTETYVLEKIQAIKEGKKMTWEQIATALYGILDDISTADDMCKENAEAFRNMVMKLQVKKNQYMQSPDGFMLQRVNEGFAGVQARKAKPTSHHRPAMWEAMLGTVVAMNDRGQIRYFDYDHAGAREFAGIDSKRDVRIWKAPETRSLTTSDRIKKGQWVVYVERGVKKRSAVSGESVCEGTWEIPFSVEKAQAIQKLMAAPISPDEARDKMYSLYGDDELFDAFLEAKRHGDKDVRPLIAYHVEELLKNWHQNPGSFKGQFDDNAVDILQSIVDANESITWAYTKREVDEGCLDKAAQELFGKDFQELDSDEQEAASEHAKARAHKPTGRTYRPEEFYTTNYGKSRESVKDANESIIEMTITTKPIAPEKYPGRFPSETYNVVTVATHRGEKYYVTDHRMDDGEPLVIHQDLVASVDEAVRTVEYAEGPAPCHWEVWAHDELRRAGFFDSDSDYEGMLGEAIMELVRSFSRQGHSGMSAAMTSDIFSRLSSWKPLSPLTSDPDEWMDLPEGLSDHEMKFQSRRDPSCFSEDGGKTYWSTDDECFKEVDENGITWHTGGKERWEKRTIHTSEPYKPEAVAS